MTVRSEGASFTVHPWVSQKQRLEVRARLPVYQGRLSPALEKRGLWGWGTRGERCQGESYPQPLLRVGRQVARIGQEHR